MKDMKNHIINEFGETEPISYTSLWMKKVDEENKTVYFRTNTGQTVQLTFEYILDVAKYASGEWKWGIQKK